MGGTAGQTVFQLAIFVALARTLTPEIFGIVAIATAMIDILNLIGRGGLVEVVVQRQTVSERTLNATFFASVILGLLMTASMIFSSKYVSYAFGISDLYEVVLILAPTCLLFSAGAVYEAKLRRDYQFKQLAVRNVTATLVSGSVALVMALTGFGIYALIAQRLISTAWGLMAMVVAARWMPRLDLEFDDIVKQLKDGFSISISALLGAGNQRLIDLIIGYFLGATALGYLRIAWRILDLLNELVVRPFANVTLTTLARTKQDGGDLAKAYVSTIRYGAIFIIPVFIGCAAISVELVEIMFGPQWNQSAKLLSYLALVGFLVPLIWFKSNILIASGQFRHVIIVNSVEFFLSVVVVAIFSPFGLVSAAIGNVVRTAIATPFILIYLQRLLGVSIWETIRVTLPPTTASVAMFSAILGLGVAFQAPKLIYVGLIFKVFAGAMIYAIVMLLLDRTILTDIKRFVRR